MHVVAFIVGYIVYLIIQHLLLRYANVELHVFPMIFQGDILTGLLSGATLMICVLLLYFILSAVLPT